MSLSNQGRSDARREERREGMLRIAREAFLEDGYAGTSMSTISARLGGSKGTLYAYFRSKEELFQAVVEDMVEEHAGLLRRFADVGGGLEEVLMAFGTRLLGVVTSPEPLKLQRLVTAEAERFPELGRALYESGPRQCQEDLAAFLRQAIAMGHLREHDAAMSARQFVGLCRARTHELTLWNIVPPLTPAEIESHVREAVSTFMAAFGPRSGMSETSPADRRDDP